MYVCAYVYKVYVWVDIGKYTHWWIASNDFVFLYVLRRCTGLYVYEDVFTYLFLSVVCVFIHR